MTSLVLSVVISAVFLPADVIADGLEPLLPDSAASQGNIPQLPVSADGVISPDEDWNEAYPYGTFAFGSHQADISEPGALTENGEQIPQSIEIPVYRLGGTVGRVTAKIVYAPAITTDADGVNKIYDYAASGRDDLMIEYQDASPIASNQPLGVPAAQRDMTASSASVCAPEATDDILPGDELVLAMSEPIAADSFRWQTKAGGIWSDITDAGMSTLTVVWSDIWDFENDAPTGRDFRCIYETDGTVYCSVSLMGEEYQPDGPADPAADVLSVEENGYSRLVFGDEYGLMEFDLTFADGETVKYIRVTAIDDLIPELPELGMFTINGCEGGELSDVCNTLTLMVSDNDAGESSEIGFSDPILLVSREDGAARVRIVRTGGKSYNVTVHYETVDGTAAAGTDYAYKSGDLAFAGSIDEIEIPIELIPTSDTSEKSFGIVLSDLRGGGTDNLCTLSHERIDIILTGSSPEIQADGAGQNLAAVLTSSDGEDISSFVGISDEPLITSGSSDSVLAVSMMEGGEKLTADTVTGSGGAKAGAAMLRSHVVNPNFSFNRKSIANYETSKYWRDWEVALGSGLYEDSASTVGYGGKLTSYMMKTASNNNGGEIVVKNLEDYSYTNSAGQTETIPNYTRISANFDSKAQLSIANAGTLYSGYVFATHLSEVGRKGTNIFTKDYWLRPYIQFWSSVNSYTLDSMETKYEVYGVNDRRYYWYSQGDYDAGGKYVSGSKFGADRGSDSWIGIDDIREAPLIWGKVASLDIEFAMREQWSDENGSWNETCGNGTHTSVDILSYAFARREFETTHYPANYAGDNARGINLVFYTANDIDEAGNYVPIQAGNTALYNSLMPKISIVEGAGGVSSLGNLYVGSKIMIDSSDITGFTIPDNGLFMTNQYGEKVGKVTRNSSDSRIWYIEMLWDGMKESCLTDTYQLNIIFERAQIFEIDIAPSTPRLNDGTTIDSGRYAEVFSSFISRGPSVETASLNLAGNVPTQVGGRYFYSDKSTVWYPSVGEFTGKNGVFFTSGTKKNVQAVNFRQDAEDVILYNGRAYAGNETIYITEADLTAARIHFTFYDSEYLDSVSPMEVFIDHVEVYYDKNGDGIIGGYLDSSGKFILDRDAEGDTIDEFVALVEGDYPDSFFRAYKDKDGLIHQNFLKVYLNIRPRAYSVPIGASESDSAQLLPAFLSAVTDSSAASELTDEQRSYRYIKSNNADGHPMYGSAANAPTFVDIPLGGDVGEKSYVSETVGVLSEDKTKVIDSENVTTYTWIPEYTGQLLVPYDNPSPIVDSDNITGGAVSIAGETPSVNSDGTYNYSDKGRDNVNASLGSFSGRTTFAIGIQEQAKSPSQRSMLRAASPDITSLDDINPETISVGTVGSTPSPDGLMNMTGGDAGQTSGAGPGDDTGFSEFSPDLGIELPSLELELGDYVTVIMDGYEVGFAIGIPVYQYEDTSYSGSETTEKQFDGSIVTTRKDGDGNDIKEIVKEDKGVKTKTTITTDAAPDGAGAKQRITIVETTDKDGKVKTEQTKELIYKKDWSDKNEEEKSIFKRTDSVDPPTEKTAGENFKDGFKEANGGMSTLKEFCKALTSPKKGSMKKFMDGAFEDDSLKNAKNGNGTSRGVQVSFTVQISIMFEYNPIDNCHYFKSAGLAASLGVEFTVQHRFTPVPIVYVYVKFGIEVEVKVSLSVLRNAKEGDEITQFVQGSLGGLSSGSKAVFALDMRDKPVDPESGKPSGAETARGFHLTLDGKVYMEVFDSIACSGEALTSGLLSGDGGQKEVLFEEYNRIVYIRLTPISGNTIAASELRPVIGATSKVVFDGLTITPGLSLEAGAGVGIELAKFELFVKTSVSISMTMGGYLEETDSYEGFYISGFEWALAVGFNVSLLFFNYSMDAIAIGVEGSQHGTGGYFDWNITATAANGNHTIWEKTTYTAADGKSLSSEPLPPTGFNLSNTNTGCVFRNADGTLTDTSDKQDINQGWYFSRNVSASAWWYGGKFKGEIPMDGDLSVARTTGASVSFTAQTGKMELYFKGRITITSAADGISKSFKSSPAVMTVSPGSTITVTADAGAKLDRVEFISENLRSARSLYVSSVNPDVWFRAEKQSLVHVTAPEDISYSQNIHRPEDAAASDTASRSIALRAITPTGTADFELSGYNTSGEARKLVDGLVNGYSYKLVQARGENYIVYPLMINGAPQLVLSRIVMTGDLSKDTGLVHPFDEAAADPYLMLDGDGFTDLDYDAFSDENGITVSWVSYDNADGTTFAVRTAVIAPDSPAGTSVSPASKTLESSSADFRYLPNCASDGTVWAASYGDGKNANEILKAWILAKNPGLGADDLDNISATDAKFANAVFFWATQSKLNDLYGAGTRLMSSSGASVSIPGESIENIESAVINGTTVIFYNTEQTAYFDVSGDVPVTVGLDGIGPETERGTIRRLYMRTLGSGVFGPARLIQTAVDFDSCGEDNLTSSKLTDGLYSGGALNSPLADPYYSNLSFVTADIDKSGSRTSALFEMGGNTYLIKESDIISILGGTSAASIIPLFSDTAGTDASIGSDGTSMAVVYTAPVADSLSNAIYIAWWDNNIGGWGSPTLLAMRNLQIYEDRAAYGMSGEDAELAYLGKLTTEGGHTGSMDKFTFSDLEMGTRLIENDDGTYDSQLIILTRGSMVQLTDYTFAMGGGIDDFESVIPGGKASVGFYAIAFGAGDQAVGQVRLSLSDHRFTQGDRIIGEVSFTNTGTSAIRASDAEPAGVRLYVRTDDKCIDLAKWSLTSSVPSGSEVRLTFRSPELTENLPAGSSFCLEVTEDPTYFGKDSFSETAEDLFIVEFRPELSFGTFDLKLSGISGGAAQLDLSATIANNGTADVREVYIQFSYDTGAKDINGQPIYKPVDITGSRLNTSTQMPLLKRGVDENLRNGVYMLKDSEGGTELKTGYYRSVTGTLNVPVSCFVSTDEMSGLHIRAEIYSDRDTPDIIFGVYTSDHDEYVGINNQAEKIIKHETIFTVPSHISAALGTTMNLPVTFETTSLKPDIMINEISDGTDGWEPRMGVCYYDPTRQVIVAAPNALAGRMLDEGKTPAGILQIKDMSTNSISAVAYSIGSMADGVNIYRNDTSFTFFDPNGKKTDLYAASSKNPGWVFLEKGADIGWNGGDPGEVPMNHDLSLANQDGAYLTFDTVADRITFFFMGTITVESSEFGTAQTFTSSPAEIGFKNAAGKKHTVTVTAAKGTRLDRYTAEYSRDPLTDFDAYSPQILWNRSEPDTASLLIGEPIKMTCYIVDESGIGSVYFNGMPLSESTVPSLVREDEGLWYFDHTFTENGTYTVRAYDLAGNTSEMSLGSTGYVDWFNDVISSNAVSGAPGFTRNDVTFVGDDGRIVDLTSPLGAVPWIKSGYALNSDETINSYAFYGGRFSDSALAEEKGMWRTVGNGFYLIRVDRDDGTWSRSVKVIRNIDVTEPQLSASYDGSSGAIGITASDDSGITSLSVNGYAIPVKGRMYTGVFPVALGGSYLVEVTDDAGNRAETEVSVPASEIKISDGFIKDREFDCTDGIFSLTAELDPDMISGGSFSMAASDPKNNIYSAVYSAAVTPEGETPSAGNYIRLDGVSTIYIKGGGRHVIWVIDSEGNAAQGTYITVAHPENAWNDPEYTWSDDNSRVTAKRTCSLNDTHFEEETAEVSADTVTAPTCLEEGELKYTASFKNPAFTAQDKTVPINPVGHVWGNPSYIWSDDNSEVTAKVICVHDGSHSLEETAKSVYTVDKPAKPTEEGRAHFSASFENGLFEGQTKEIVLPPTGYTYGEPVFDWNESGNVTVTFKADEGSDGDIVIDDSDDRVTVTSDTTAASCEKEGRIVYEASVTLRDSTYKDTYEKILPPSGHAWGRPVFRWSADRSSATATQTCQNDEKHVRVFNAVVKNEILSDIIGAPSRAVWTATVVIDGVEYYDTVSQTLPVNYPLGPVMAIPPVIPVIPVIPQTPADPSGGDEPVYASPASESELPFTDVKPSHPFYKDVKYVFENGIMVGVSDTEFAPSANLTRGMIVTILYRLEGEPHAAESGKFDDVAPGEWYSAGVGWAAENGIVLGYGDGSFGPSDPVTREQLSAILCRYAGYKGYPISSARAEALDSDEISGYAAESVGWANVTGILACDDDGNIRPTDDATRAEVARAIHAFMTNVKP